MKCRPWDQCKCTSLLIKEDKNSYWFLWLVIQIFLRIHLPHFFHVMLCHPPCFHLTGYWPCFLQNLRQPCTPDTEGLLYFDLLSSKMYRCSNRQWVEWGWGPNYLQSAMMQDSGQGSPPQAEEVDYKEPVASQEESESPGGTKTCPSGRNSLADPFHGYPPHTDSATI